MTPREVDLEFELLDKDIDQAELADRLGISEGTLRGYIRNRWTVLDRNVLERLLDLLQCDAASVLKTKECPFFKPFQDRPVCLYVRRPDAAADQRITHRDYGATKHVEKLLRDWVDPIAVAESFATTPDQFNRVLAENCIIVGSPMVNPAAELAFCHAFGATPFDPNQRVRLPFTFQAADRPDLPVSTVFEPSPSGKQGIWLRSEGVLIEADHWPLEEFKRMRISEGRDCAVVLVANRRSPGPSSDRRKVVVLSGFTGTGTESAATALVDHYRDLEPRGKDSPPVWGIIEVVYRKPKNTTSREVLKYKWRCRVGGRRPIDFIQKEA
jgi:transcriptional regulator with XRE-family HTH domain